MSGRKKIKYFPLLFIGVLMFCLQGQLTFAGGTKESDCFLNIKIGDSAFRIPNKDGVGAHLSKNGEMISTSGVCHPMSHPPITIQKFSLLPHDLPGYKNMNELGYPFFAVQIIGRLHDSAFFKEEDYSKYPIEGEFYKPRDLMYVFVDEAMRQPHGERVAYGCSRGYPEPFLSCSTKYRINDRLTFAARQINTRHIPIEDFKKFYLILAAYIERMRVDNPLKTNDKGDKN